MHPHSSSLVFGLRRKVGIPTCWPCLSKLERGSGCVCFKKKKKNIDQSMPFARRSGGPFFFFCLCASFRPTSFFFQTHTHTHTHTHTPKQKLQPVLSETGLSYASCGQMGPPPPPPRLHPCSSRPLPFQTVSPLFCTRTVFRTPTGGARFQDPCVTCAILKKAFAPEHKETCGPNKQVFFRCSCIFSHWKNKKPLGSRDVCIPEPAVHGGEPALKLF